LAAVWVLDGEWVVEEVWFGVVLEVHTPIARSGARLRFPARDRSAVLSPK